MRSRPPGSGGGSAGRGFRNAGEPPFGPLLPQFPKPAAALRPPASSRSGPACAVRNVVRCGQFSGVRKFLRSGTENCEFSAPKSRFSQIPPQGRHRAGGYGRIVRLEKHDGLHPLGQPLLEALPAVPPPIYSRFDNACRMGRHYVRGANAPAARPRDGGGARLPAGRTSGRSPVGPVRDTG